MNNEFSNENKIFERATFAGGCFWCMIPPFDGVEGVVESKSGYTGGKTPFPTYDKVSMGKTGHYEAIQLLFDPSLVSYGHLLDIFWQNIDPTDAGGQFHDRGSQYRSAIFYHNEEQKKLAEESREALGRSGRFDRPIAVDILKAGEFYPAEEYHQDYHKKNPVHYKLYKTGSGREAFIKSHWSSDRAPGKASGGKGFHKPDKKMLKEELTPMQYRVTQENATEPPFENEYWNHGEKGIYVDVVSGEPLFSSLDKFDSSCGWPSFTKPLEEEHLKEKTDLSHFMVRTEVRSAEGDSHLGHVFNDGPTPTGLRYCINSAALRFIPLENLEKEGYGEFRKLFS